MFESIRRVSAVTFSQDFLGWFEQYKEFLHDPCNVVRL